PPPDVYSLSLPDALPILELGVESYEVRSQHPVEDLGLPRADSEGLGVRPWNVPEECDASIGPLLLQEPGEEREVIVLDQDRRVRSEEHTSELQSLTNLVC